MSKAELRHCEECERTACYEAVCAAGVFPYCRAHVPNHPRGPVRQIASLWTQVDAAAPTDKRLVSIIEDFIDFGDEEEDYGRIRDLLAEVKRLRTLAGLDE